MKAATLATVTLLLLLAPPQAAAQESVTHLTVKAMEIPAHGNESYPIATGEGPWLEGMVLIVVVAFPNEAGIVLAHVAHRDGQAVDTLRFEQTVSTQSTLIPRDGVAGDYSLRLENPTNNTVQILVYFDQTCSCTEKPVPLPLGYVVFHYDLKKGIDYKLSVPSVKGWTLEAKLATRGAGDAWPQDFNIVSSDTVQGQGWLEFSITPPDDRRYFLFLQATAGVVFPPDENEPGVSITPLLEVPEPPKKSPASPWFIIAAIALALARRR